MYGRCYFLVTVYLVSVSLDFSAAGRFRTSNSNFCFWTRSISNGRTHHMFLHQTTAGKERSITLFDSIWNKQNNLVECMTSNNHAAIKGFSWKCWKARDRPFSANPDGRFNISMLVKPDGPCVAVGHPPELIMPLRRTRDLERMDYQSIYQKSGDSSQKLQRSKRAWMIPGTLWCGSGNKASAFSDLGLFEETDKCCREHDHCDQTIASFEFGYGIFNTNFFTLSHCDCDIKFRHCLHNTNNKMSDMVGYGYFNLLKMQCFEFSQRMECAERTWWGMCKHSQMSTYALVRDANDYNSTFPILEDDKLDLTIHQTVSFGDLTVTNDLIMSSDVVPEETNDKHSSLSVPQMLSVTVNTSQETELYGKTIESLKPNTTDASKTTDSPDIITDSEHRETRVSSHIKTTGSSNTTDSPDIITDSEHRETRVSSHIKTTGSSNTTDSPDIITDSEHSQTRVSSHIKTTGSSNTTDSPDIITDSEHSQTRVSLHIKTTGSSKGQTTDGPNTETTDTTKTPIPDSTNTQIPASSMIQTTDSPIIKTTVSLKTQTRYTKRPQTNITDSTEAETTSTPQIKLKDSSKPNTDSPKSETRQTTDSTTPQSTSSAKMHIHPQMETRPKGKPDTCEGYKDLDSCRYQIPALREKYGVRNSEHTTLYHCNCTARLARELAEEDEVDKVHFWLLDFVSPFCFFLPTNCTGSESCSTSSHNDPPLIERWSHGAAVWRHLAAPRRKSKRVNSKRSKRKDSPIRLHKKCLRMHSRLHQSTVKEIKKKTNPGVTV
ncbi:group 3 secretory phospholipase A2 [Clarias gariepinus]|uniref:group 3 secretory phospholipase A2 n=1 Tax=Clarias gariepinus TaxID=13013 RepID=UPI00234D7774|nr:group 3 secretory phospholipase A2 [Clarias gariepinus]